MKELNTLDVNNQETREMLLEYARRIQVVEKEIEGLKESKKELFADAKSQGFDTKILRKAISEIRKEKNENPLEKSEEELYKELLSDVIEPLK